VSCACVRNVPWFRVASIGWINVSLSVGHPPRAPAGALPPVAGQCWPSSAASSFDASVLPHSLSPSLDRFCQFFSKVSVDMSMTPTCCLLLALFARTPLCLRSSLLDLDSAPCAWLVTIPLKEALYLVLQVLFKNVSSLSTFRPSVPNFSNYFFVSSRPTVAWVLTNPQVQSTVA